MVIISAHYCKYFTNSHFLSNMSSANVKYSNMQYIRAYQLFFCCKWLRLYNVYVTTSDMQDAFFYMLFALWVAVTYNGVYLIFQL